MTDVQGLNDIIDKSGLKKDFLAEILDISRQTLYAKLDGTSEFKASEIYKLAEALHLTARQRDALFFCKKA